VRTVVQVRVLILDCEYGPVRPVGGLQVLLMRWAQEIGREWDVTLGSIRGNGDQPERYRVPGEMFTRQIFEDLDEVRAAAARYDAMSFHQWYEWVVAPERTLLMLHSSIEECYRDEAAAGVCSPDWQRVVKGLQAPHTVATCAHWATATVEQHTARRAVTLHPGIDDTYLTTQSLPASKRRPVVACSGRMTARKGVDVLLDLAEAHAFGGLVLELPAFSPDPGMLERATALESSGAPVRVIPQIKDSVAHAEYLRSVAVVAAPSVLEGFGMVAVEAQAVGVPVVGVDAGGLREAVLPGGGVLVAAGAPSELAEAVKECARLDVAADVRAEIANRFSIQASADAKRAVLAAIAAS
jgi:glycosyltransferase involved in cell wall biosynthesis